MGVATKAVEEGTSFSAVEAREKFADLVNRSAYRGERITLTRRGKGVAAVVPIEDLQLLEQLEDRIDAAEARRELREWKKSGEPSIPIAEVKRRLGL